MPSAPLAACLEPRCPNRAVGRGRCARHRLSTSQRGYGLRHQRARDALRASLPTPCGYGCGRILQPDGDWVAAHVVDGDPEAGWIAACPLCNERAKGGRGRHGAQERPSLTRAPLLSRSQVSRISSRGSDWPSSKSPEPPSRPPASSDSRLPRGLTAS